MDNPLRELERHGQSVWYDSLRRGILASGELARYVAEDGLTGLTTNPAIYEKAIVETTDYDDELRSLLPRSDLDPKAIYERLAHDARPEREHVHRVVLAALVRGVVVVAEPRPDARDLVGGGGDAHPAAADDDAALGAPAADRLGDGLREVGVVARGRVVGPEVLHLVALRREVLLQLEPSVIARERDAHLEPRRDPARPGRS